MRSPGARGRAAEEAGARYLEERGYRVVARNHRSRAGELDVVAWDGPVLCFVEVRSRRSGSLGLPEETVDGRKQARVARAASAYLLRFEEPPPCRFDVLAIERHPETGYAFRLYQDAFRL